MKNGLFLIIGLVFIFGSLYLFLQKPAPVQRVKIGDKTFTVEVADTDIERAQGLSGRVIPEEGHGMLFVFPEPGLYGFWMKNMRFSIDIVWLDEEFKVIDIEQNVEPETFPQTFYPPIPIKYVVEVSSGEL